MSCTENNFYNLDPQWQKDLNMFMSHVKSGQSLEQQMKGQLALYHQWIREGGYARFIHRKVSEKYGRTGEISPITKKNDNLLTDLKSYIINDIYKNILLEKLKLKVSEKELLDKKISELQDIATFHKIDFNILISRLHKEIENSIEIVDFNSMNIAWIIIAYFFELCDVGVDEIC